MKIAFLINGLICNQKKIFTELSTAFEAFSFDFFVSQYRKHMIELCHEALTAGFDTIAVVGGDGTINEVVNGIITYHKKANNIYDWESIARVKLVVIPRGGGNDFSKMLYKGNSLSTISELLKNNQFQLTDVGLAQFHGFDNKEAHRFYINITDIGIGGDVVQKRDLARRWLPGKLNYSLSILSTFLTYKKKAVDVSWGNQTWSGKVMGLIVANGKYFGSGLGIAPKAKTNDGVLSVVRLGDISVLDYLKHLGNVKKCLPIQHPEVDYSTAKEIKITPSNQSQIPIDMDGEFVGVAPLTITCLPKKMLVLQG